MASINLMVKRIAGLVDTSDVNDWDNTFIQSVLKQTKDGDNTTSLTERQLDLVERIFNKHFFG